MTDIVTGIFGIVLFVVFLGFVLVKIADIAFWIVCAATIVAMLYAFWGDVVAPTFRRRENYDRGEAGL
ncbi:MAG TPA: hypothetical protein VHG27_03395 [Xanthobacteraceae bacterium]|nr:hypothetical protein [Xanthobacteraceae bacterium]